MKLFYVEVLFLMVEREKDWAQWDRRVKAYVLARNENEAVSILKRMYSDYVERAEYYNKVLDVVKVKVLDAGDVQLLEQKNV